MQYEKYLRFTIFENSYDESKTHGKLDYIYVNEQGVQDKDFTVHHKMITNEDVNLRYNLGEESEIDRTIREFKRQTKMSDYQLQRDGYIVKIDYHRAKRADRKNKLMDAISIKTEHKNDVNLSYVPRNSKKKNIVTNLQVRDKNVRDIVKKGFEIAAVVAALFVAGKVYTALTTEPKRDFVEFHKADSQPTREEKSIVNGLSRMENIINKLVREKYNELSLGDIKFLEDYYTALGIANNDKNNNFFNHYMYESFEKGLNKSERYIFNKVQLLINSAYKNERESNRYHYYKQAEYKYLIYTMTLVSGGEDPYPYERGSNKALDVASIDEGRAFYFMKPEYKLPILINLRETLRVSDIDFRELNLGYNIYKIESYQFDKQKFIQKLDDDILLARTQLESMCDVKTRGK